MCNKANSWNKTNLLTNYRFFINRQFVVRVVELASSGGSWTLGLRVPSTHLQGRKKEQSRKTKNRTPARLRPSCILWLCGPHLLSHRSSATRCSTSSPPSRSSEFFSKSADREKPTGSEPRTTKPTHSTAPFATRCCFWNSSCVARPRVRPAEREQGGAPRDRHEIQRASCNVEASKKILNWKRS